MEQNRQEINRANCNCRLELSGEEYRKIVDRHINHIDESLRTPDDEYRERLRLCGECAYQVNQMCRMCGCFVEIRASRKNMYCPLDPPTWSRVQEKDRSND